MGSPAPCLWHRDPTYALCPEPRGGQPEGPPLPTPPLEERISRPLAPCSPGSSQPRGGTVGDGRGEGDGRSAAQGGGRLSAALAAANGPATLPARPESAKRSVFRASQAAAGPRKDRAPRSEEPGVRGGFAWRTRVASFVSERGCTSRPRSTASARDLETAQARCGIWEVVMDRPGQQDGANNRPLPSRSASPSSVPRSCITPTHPQLLWFYFFLVFTYLACF